MKAIVPFITLLALSLVVLPVIGGDDVQLRKAFFEFAIDDEIVKCRKGASLRESRSINLRLKGHREASMALFLETHREELVADMLAAGLAPKTYKVQRFLNDRFCNTCYAQWAAQSDL